MFKIRLCSWKAPSVIHFLCPLELYQWKIPFITSALWEGIGKKNFNFQQLWMKRFLTLRRLSIVLPTDWNHWIFSPCNSFQWILIWKFLSCVQTPISTHQGRPSVLCCRLNSRVILCCTLNKLNCFLTLLRNLKWVFPGWSTAVWKVGVKSFTIPGVWMMFYREWATMSCHIAFWVVVAIF